jgi:hypothetical protein
MSKDLAIRAVGKGSRGFDPYLVTVHWSLRWEYAKEL